MARKRYSPEEIIGRLREAEVALAEGATVAEVCRRIGMTQVTYYRWRKEYGGMRAEQARRLKELEVENTRLRKAVSELTLEARCIGVAMIFTRGDLKLVRPERRTASV